MLCRCYPRPLTIYQCMTSDSCSGEVSLSIRPKLFHELSAYTSTQPREQIMNHHLKHRCLFCVVLRLACRTAPLSGGGTAYTGVKNP